MTYMDALAADIQKFTRAPCQVVDEASQVIVDAVVIPEENLESMLQAFKIDAPATCASNQSAACGTPSVERSYTL